MKIIRTLSFLLAFIMLFSLSSCASLQIFEKTGVAEKKEESAEETEEILETGPITLPQGFSVGYAKKAANPEEGVGLGGWGTESGRLSNRILDDIMLTCTALSDGENVFLLIGVDVLYVGADLIDSVTKRVQKLFPELAIPAENVIMNATHTHTAPAIHSMNGANMGQYMKKFYPTLYFVIEKALRTLSPATMEYASTNTEGLNYVRRYVSLDGKEYLGNWPDPMPSSVGRHETNADNQMQILRFEREKGKDVVLVNWQCHPCSSIAGATRTLVSADWVGSMRENVEKNMDVEFAYFQGAAGNLVSSTKIIGEKTNDDYKKKGKELAEVVEKALEKTTVLETEPFRAVQTKSEYRNNSGSTGRMYLSALSLGPVAIATAPCEYHDSLGKEVKEASPFEYTLFFGYTNGNHGYIPADYAFELGGYEVNSTHYPKGTGEKMADELKSILNQIYSDKQN